MAAGVAGALAMAVRGAPLCVVELPAWRSCVIPQQHQLVAAPHHRMHLIPCHPSPSTSDPSHLDLEEDLEWNDPFFGIGDLSFRGTFQLGLGLGLGLSLRGTCVEEAEGIPDLLQRLHGAVLLPDHHVDSHVGQGLRAASRLREGVVPVGEVPCRQGHHEVVRA